MNECVLDASAILACLNDEPGGEAVEALTRQATCLTSAVNHAEVLTRLCDWGLSMEDAIEAAASLDLCVVVFDEPLSRQVAALRQPTRAKGLSLGDRACLALAQHRACPVHTADRPWLDLAGALGLDIQCIRPDAH
ncbi:MAG: type II toxin-antitoxin system VapC family toxin [Sulfurisoma sp.]|nr:type II toxin-antitoxin system VapC family toxin [Sulfurisoma sp.]